MKNDNFDAGLSSLHIRVLILHHLIREVTSSSKSIRRKKKAVKRPAFSIYRTWGRTKLCTHTASPPSPPTRAKKPEPSFRFIRDPLPNFYVAKWAECMLKSRGVQKVCSCTRPDLSQRRVECKCTAYPP